MINNSQEIIKFSIVITTYNRCQLVKRAINSALQQTINCEVIVIDDCSSDQTEIELKIYQNQIIYVRNKINKGHSESVNLGVSLAQGNWLKLLDDDDYLTSDCLAELLSQIRLNPSVVISSCQAFKVNERGKKIKKTKRVGNQINYLVT